MSRRKQLFQYVQLAFQYALADSQIADAVPVPVGPDGWPIDLENAITSPQERSQVS